MTLARDLLDEASRTVDRADAEFMLMTLLDVGRHELGLDTTLVAPGLESDFLRMLPAAARGAPPQYLVHNAPFLDFAVHVDARVLIPRPETEGLVSKTLELVGEPGLIVDYGTGSGCIAIALGRALPRSRILAVDASADALAVARLNVDRHRLGSRITLVRAAGLADPVFAALRGEVGLLVSNPPYVPTGRLALLEPRVRDHEPKAALDGGPNGTNILSMLLEQGPALLAPAGLLALEIDDAQVACLSALASAARFDRDLAGRMRYLFLRRERKP